MSPPIEHNNSPTGNPEALPYERGSLDHLNASLLSLQLESDIRMGLVKRSEVAGWLTQPWTLARFIEGKVSPKYDHDVADPKLTPIAKIGTMITAALTADQLDTVREWAKVADRGSAQRIQWEVDHVAEKQAVEDTVKRLHDAMEPSLKVFEQTNSNLTAHKGLNLVEDTLRSTKAYIIDDFREHPEMSVGIIIVGYAVYNMIKGRKIWDILKWGSAITIGGAFLKDKFGIQPVNAIAKMADNVNLPLVGDGIRKLSDTVSRGIFGADGAGTVNGFYQEKLKLSEKDETLAFRHVLSENPKKLLKSYDAIKAWKLDRTKRLPPDAADLVRRMDRREELPSYWQNYDEGHKADILADVIDKVFTHVATVNGNMQATPDQGLALVKGKYVDGEYFNLLWNRSRAFEQDLMHRYTDPALREEIHRIMLDAGTFYQKMVHAVEAGSDIITLQHILVLEAGDPKVFQDYNGPGLSLGDVSAAARMGMNSLMTKGGQAGKYAKDEIEHFFMNTVPTYWSNVYEEHLKSFFGDVKRFTKEDFDIVVLWYKNVVVPRMEKLGNDAATEIFIPIATFSKPILDAIGANAKNGLIMTRDQIEKFGKWLEEKDREFKATESLQSFTVSWDATKNNATVKIAKPIPALSYTITHTVIAIDTKNVSAKPVPLSLPPIQYTPPDNVGYEAMDAELQNIPPSLKAKKITYTIELQSPTSKRIYKGPTVVLDVP